MIVITSGLPRCGTSLMMRMLNEGGMPILTDHVRHADEDNPGGYYELEIAKKIATDTSWLDEAQGKSFKMVSLLLFHLPADRFYKIIFMTRDMSEILASQAKMLERRGESQAAGNADMQKSFESHLARVKQWMNIRNNIDVLYCSYNSLMDNPAGEAARVAAFLDNNLDVGKMIQIVDPSLYRRRHSARTASAGEPAIATGAAV